MKVYLTRHGIAWGVGLVGFQGAMQAMQGMRRRMAGRFRERVLGPRAMCLVADE